MTQVCKCGRPTAGAWLCPDCIQTLEHAIVNVQAHYGDLDTLRRKQTRYAESHGKSSIGKAQPLIVDARFTDKTGAGSQLEDDTRNTVSTWCRIVMDEEPQVPGPFCHHACLHTSCAALFRKRWPSDTMPSMCAYLLRQLRHITQQEWAEEILDEFTDVEKRLSRMVDRPADRWYAGRCKAETEGADGSLFTCDAELYAKADKGYVDCRTCGIRHDIGERREVLLREARDVLVTATEAAGALMAWTDYNGSESKLVDRIRKWAAESDGRPARLSSRGSIEHLGRDRSLYRLGDIEALAMSSKQDSRLRGLSRTA